MEYLFRRWDSVAKQLLRSRRRLILFDYDGTLAPIMHVPHLARMSLKLRMLMRQLAERRGYSVGIISGRSLSQARRLVGIPGLIYAGNHGFEITRNGTSFQHPEAKAQRRLLRTLARRLALLLKKVPGAWVENKTYTLCVHYRQARPKQVPAVRQIVQTATTASAYRKKVTVQRGKKSFDILPNVQWSKGEAVRWLWNKGYSRPATIYIGDDVTDESVFAALGPRGLSIRIGPKKQSHACYYLKNQNQMTPLLERLVTL